MHGITRPRSGIDVLIGDDQNTQVRFKPDVRSLRAFRSALVELAQSISDQPEQRGILWLETPHITEKRLRSEWQATVDILKPQVSSRLSIVISDGQYRELLDGFYSSEELRELAKEIEPKMNRLSRSRHTPISASEEILRVLLIHWFRRIPPQTSKHLCDLCECSYPTLAAALKQWEPYLQRTSDRRVGLKSFPTESWNKLAANASGIRETQHFTDRSGNPRPIEKLLERLEKLNAPNIAIGGSIGARFHYRPLDLVGNPKLDLTVQIDSDSLELPDLARQLDPALKPAAHGESIRLSIHFLGRPKSFFLEDPEENRQVSDEVECLLDLLSARLDVQAAEFLDWLIKKANS